MRDSRTTASIQPVPAMARSRALTVTLWVLQALLAFQFAGGGLMKLGGAPVMVEMFATIGAGQWLRFLVGALELAGAIGLLVPRLAGLAALGLCALMLGAITTNLLILKVDTWFPLGLLAISALVAWARWAEVRQALSLRSQGS